MRGMFIIMKTRVISGIVMGVIVAAVFALGYLWESIVISIAVSLLSALAVCELLHNAAGIKDIQSVLGACVFAFIITMQNYFAKGFLQSLKIIFLVSVLYSIYAAIMILKNHGKFGLGRIMALYSVPIIYGTAFSCLEGIVTSSNGIYYLLLLLNFSSVCDMGAYFVGVTLGKHKLCPKISPKKTVEGAIGGILASLIVTMILSLYFDKTMWIMLIATIPFCILGMIGDLFASAIKRAVDIKDYGNLIPGHGGVMDRLDSIIMIVPTMYALILLSVI